MKIKALVVPAMFFLALAASSLGPRAEAQNHGQLRSPGAASPAGATRCDLMLPLSIEITPLEEPAVGRSARFEVRAESGIDPDLVRRSWIEYEFPPQLRRPGSADRRDELGRAGRGRTELDLVFPAEDSYEIRARLVLELADGKRISQTAVRFIQLGGPRPPEAMLGRIVDSGGDGIRVYRGITVRN